MKVFVALILVAAGGQRCYASPLPDEDLVTDASSVHYSYGRQYGYNHGVKGHYAPAYGHRDYGYNYKYKPYRSHGYGYAHKHGYHNDVYAGYGYKGITHGHAPGYEYSDPHHHGYVPIHAIPAFHDVGHGFAAGHDAVGPFYHHTGAFGPFGFYANFYHDL